MPCYNTSPLFLNEAVDSILAYKGQYNYEIIVIDDGSTEAGTLKALDDLKAREIVVIRQQNQGPSAARNNAVKYTAAKFLLCLDSDNTVQPEFIDEGISLLNSNAKCAVVYAKPKFTGDASRNEYEVEAFNIERLFIENYIDMCSVIRRSAWESAGGLDITLKQHEDWEFWLRLYKAGWQFNFVDKVLFTYRIRQGSLITQQEDAYKKIIAYIYQKHWDLLYEVFHKLYSMSIIYKDDKQRPLRSFIKYLTKPS